jgi:translation initiation factor IF-3
MFLEDNKQEYIEYIKKENIIEKKNIKLPKLTLEQSLKLELKNKYKINNDIINTKILLILDNEKIFCTKDEAMTRALNNNLDLLEIHENNDLSICKIINFEDFLYKKIKEKKVKKIINNHKIIKLKSTICDNDLERKIKHIEMFFQKKYTVQIQITSCKRERINGRFQPRLPIEEQRNIIIKKLEKYNYEIILQKDKKSFNIIKKIKKI